MFLLSVSLLKSSAIFHGVREVKKNTWHKNRETLKKHGIRKAHGIKTHGIWTCWRPPHSSATWDLADVVLARWAKAKMESIFRCHLETKRGLKSLVDVSKFKSGTMYMMCKELSKSLTCPLTMTGFKVEPKADGSQAHGFSLTHESDWCFLPTDKNVSNWTSGNICRDLARTRPSALKVPMGPIHGKLTTKKPFLMLTQCLTWSVYHLPIFENCIFFSY